MKKRTRIAVLAAIALVVVALAGSAWLGFLPLARPDNEQDFMAQQLRRVRFAGPLRSEHEKALAELLPPDPTIDDLRVAFWKRSLALDAALRQELLKAQPELQKFKLPGFDQSARHALDAINARAAKIESTTKLDAWLRQDGKGWDQALSQPFLDQSSDLPGQLASAIPASGQVLLKVSLQGNVDLPANFGAATRVMVVRVRCLYTTGQVDQGWQELLQLAGFCSNAQMGPTLVGLLCSDLMHSVLLRSGVLPLASTGEMPPAQLEEFLARYQLTPPKVLEIARVEELLALTRTANAGENHQALFAKSWTEQAFESQGATSLSQWLEHAAQDSQRRHEGWGARLDGLDKRGGNFRDPQQAATLLDTSDRDKGDWVLDQTKLLATAAAGLAESEGLLLAVKLYAAKGGDPAGWRTQAADFARDFPFSAIGQSGEAIEVRLNNTHPVMAYLKESNRVLATVR
ncbi:MAG: hypothetical protein IPP14_04970 [Planctomycetes bacterium]|nr:hypothetical protein [Planctomycetota bacterium]